MIHYTEYAKQVDVPSADVHRHQLPDADPQPPLPTEKNVHMCWKKKKERESEFPWTRAFLTRYPPRWVPACTVVDRDQGGRGTDKHAAASNPAFSWVFLLPFSFFFFFRIFLLRLLLHEGTVCSVLCAFGMQSFAFPGNRACVRNVLCVQDCALKLEKKFYLNLLVIPTPMLLLSW